MHLLLTRPDAGTEIDPLHAALLAEGHTITHAPLLSVVSSGLVPSLDGAQALIVTSRNGLKAIVGSLTDAARALPLFAVGPATAALGRTLGFRRVFEGTGGARELSALIVSETQPTAGPLVHLSGDAIAFDLGQALEADGFEVRREIVYRMEPTDALPSEAAAALRAGTLDGVVLMSPRTARIYAKLVRDRALDAGLRGIVHYCLSEAVARELAVLNPVRWAVARSPNSQEMLALIARSAADSF
jgi:uroporphyrinogen-III synthase